MSDVFGDIEAKLNKVKEAREMEVAIDHCQRGVLNEGVVYKIAAETDYGTQRGGAERSINITFTIEESRMIFEAVEIMLVARLAGIKRDLGL
jgi:hypothetical protein